jgi:hypothetical protein
MHIINLKSSFLGMIIMLGAAGFAIADDKAPDLPTGCEELAVEEGNKVSFHTYAIGVQRYRWNGTAWVFVEPVAKLFANENYRGETGTHYVGPTWESNSGSKVVATRDKGCNVDPTAIDWLLLKTVSNEGPGPFDQVTFVQRVNTVGGRAPAAPGSAVGALVDVPYTAEYYFYREKS